MCFVHFFEKTLNRMFRFLTTALVIFMLSRYEAKVVLMASVSGKSVAGQSCFHRSQNLE